MSGREFVTDPDGFPFDPDKLIVVRRDGAKLADLPRRLYEEGEFWPRPDQRALMVRPGDARPGVWEHRSWDLSHPTFG